MTTIIAYLFWINIIAFCVYAFDKGLAIRQKRRIPEWLLLSLAVIGGSIGALTAMLLYRHKTNKKTFSVTVPLMVLLLFLLFALKGCEGGTPVPDPVPPLPPEPEESIVLQVKSRKTDLPIEGASVMLTCSDHTKELQLVTDSDGKCGFSYSDANGQINRLLATKAGYSGVQEINLLYMALINYPHVIYMDEMRRCSDQVADNGMGHQGNHAVQDYQMNQKGGVFKFSYYTDSAPDVITIYDGSSEDYAKGKAKSIFHFDGATNTTSFTPLFEQMVGFTSSTICVVVDNGTNWGYKVHCPVK